MQPENTPRSGEIIAVQVIPKAGRDAVDGLVTDAQGRVWLKIRVSAAPEEGRANKAVLALLAKHRGVAPSRLSLISGETGRKKRVKLD
jgi:uncharacterized protein (TIGR00251 family)